MVVLLSIGVCPGIPFEGFSSVGIELGARWLSRSLTRNDTKNDDRSSAQDLKKPLSTLVTHRGTSRCSHLGVTQGASDLFNPVSSNELTAES
jgi:hypothetical protein